MRAKADILDKVASHVDEGFLLGLTRDLVRIPSVNPKFEKNESLNREPDVQELLAATLKTLGFKTRQYEVFPGRPNLIASRDGDDARSLVLNGHVDVVPTGDTSKWTKDPFGGEVHGGKLYGRGSLDMKGGIAAGIAALKAIQDAGMALKGWVDVHTVVDEEAGGFGSISAVKHARLPNGLVVLEPTWGEILPAEGGLDWVRVTIKGRNGHSAWRYNEIYPQAHTADRLEPAVNAIELGVRFLTALKEFERDRARRVWHPLLPPGVNSINPGVIRAGTDIGADGLPKVMTNPAIIPDAFVVDLDYKFMPHEKPTEVRAEFEHFVRSFAETDSWLRANPPEIQWDLYDLFFPPLNTPVEHPLVEALVEARKDLGKDARISGFIAVCDAAHYAGAGVPGVIHGPSGGALHGVDEYVDIASLIDTAKAIARAVVTWCGVRD